MKTTDVNDNRIKDTQTAIDVLCDHETDFVRRIEAIRYLGHIAVNFSEKIGLDDFYYLFEGLEDPHYAVRFNAISEISKVHFYNRGIFQEEEVLDMLREMSLDKEVFVSGHAKHLLDEYLEERSIAKRTPLDILRKVSEVSNGAGIKDLRDPNWVVRLAAVQSLANRVLSKGFGGCLHPDILQEVLVDKSSLVRYYTVAAVYKICRQQIDHGKCMKIFFFLLVDMSLSDQDRCVRALAANALKNLEDIEEFRKAGQEVKSLLKDMDSPKASP